MQTETLPVSQSVSKRLTTCRAAIATMEAEIDKLSFDAVMGDETARQQLAEISTRLANARRDEDMLVAALRHAGDIEAEAVVAAELARRAKHMDAAHDASKRLRDLAARADAVIVEFANLLDDIDVMERRIHIEVGLAGKPASMSIVGRSGLSVRAMDHVSNCRAKGDFRTPKSLADIVRSAWGELFAGDAS
jgi:hypothetical protein